MRAAENDPEQRRRPAERAPQLRDAGVDIDAATLSSRRSSRSPRRRRGAAPMPGSALRRLFDLKAAGSPTPSWSHHRRRRHQAEDRDSAGKHDTIASTSCHVRQRPRRPGRRAAVLPGLFRDRKLAVETGRTIVAASPRLREVGCALVGGETAEMRHVAAATTTSPASPSAPRARRDPRRGGIVAGDVVLGLARAGSTRRLLAGAADRRERGTRLCRPAPFAPTQSLAEALLVRPGSMCAAALPVRGGGVKALAHITGGGSSRTSAGAAAGLTAELDARSWALPPVFAGSRPPPGSTTSNGGGPSLRHRDGRGDRADDAEAVAQLLREPARRSPRSARSYRSKAAATPSCATWRANGRAEDGGPAAGRVLISGRGSNLRSLIEAARAGFRPRSHRHRQPSGAGLAHAARAGIAHQVIAHRDSRPGVVRCRARRALRGAASSSSALPGSCAC